MSGRLRLFCVVGALLVTAVVLTLVNLSSSPETRPDILLITVDTLRADALSVYGAPEGSTPTVAELAEDSVIYERARTPMPLTRPALTSLMTSLHPRVHGVLSNRKAFTAGVPTLPSILRRHGYATGGFVGVILLGRGSGFARGFDAFEQPRRRKQMSAERVISGAVEWLETISGNQPLFAWVHLFEPHQPYDPPDAFRTGLDAQLAVQMPSVRWETLDAAARNEDGDISSSLLEHTLRLYGGEVEYVDQQLGELLAAFARHRGHRSRLVVLTADHGECFENGVYFEHADCLFEGAVRIPLLVRYPNASSSRREVRPVSLLDVAPTILRVAGIAAPPIWRGHPLQDAPMPARALLLQQPIYEVEKPVYRERVIRTVAGVPIRPAVKGTEVTALVDSDWKLLQLPTGDELYRMRPVPDESRSLTAEQPDAAAKLRAALEAARAAIRLNRTTPEQVDPEHEDLLRSLGYVQ